LSSLGLRSRSGAAVSDDEASDFAVDEKLEAPTQRPSKRRSIKTEAPIQDLNKRGEVESEDVEEVEDDEEDQDDDEDDNDDAGEGEYVYLYISQTSCDSFWLGSWWKLFKII
jgi:hypothetical protein